MATADGSAFYKIVTSLVNDIIMPPIGRWWSAPRTTFKNLRSTILTGWPTKARSQIMGPARPRSVPGPHPLNQVLDFLNSQAVDQGADPSRSCWWPNASPNPGLHPGPRGHLLCAETFTWPRRYSASIAGRRCDQTPCPRSLQRRRPRHHPHHHGAGAAAAQIRQPGLAGAADAPAGRLPAQLRVHRHLLDKPPPSLPPGHQRVNGAVLWANLHLLFWLSLVPFATGWIAEQGCQRLPVVLYGVLLLGAAIAYFILVRTIFALEGPKSELALAHWPGRSQGQGLGADLRVGHRPGLAPAPGLIRLLCGRGPDVAGAGPADRKKGGGKSKVAPRHVCARTGVLPTGVGNGTAAVASAPNH